MPISHFDQTPPPGMTLTYYDGIAVLQADETTVLRIPKCGDAFPTDRYAISASRGTGSGPYCMIHNLTRNQLRQLALNILDAIG